MTLDGFEYMRRKITMTLKFVQCFVGLWHCAVWQSVQKFHGESAVPMFSVAIGTHLLEDYMMLLVHTTI